MEQAVDRGEVQGEQSLSNRQDLLATAVQGHFRRRDAASSLRGREGTGNVARVFERHWHENFEHGLEVMEVSFCEGHVRGSYPLQATLTAK